MKKFLPIFFLLFSVFFVPITYAQTPTPAPLSAPDASQPIPVTIVDPYARDISGATCPHSADAQIVCDPEVQFIGQASSRAKDFLNWTMANYRWIDTGASSPISSFWVQISRIMSILLLIFVLATGFILIITRGRSVTVVKFVPRFILAVIFAVLSFSIIQFLYQVTDVIMGFFMQGPGLKAGSIDPILKVISGDNLFYISWDYNTFIGYRYTDPRFQEAAFTSILLLKLTAITFYIMAGLLLARKVILWLFIAVSPVFPFLLLYYPIRNTGKIWIGEFFRWLLYGPLFAIFLYGLVVLWQFQPTGASPNTPGIPLNFNTANPETKQPYNIGTDIKYPTAINIVIGGPGQTISRTNNVNLPGTFALYVFALIMVWIITFFPFVLLRIFLDQMNNMMGGEGWIAQQLRKTPFGKPPTPPSLPPVMPVNPGFPPSPFSPKGAPTGMAKPMPVGAALRLADNPVNQQILKTADLSVPSLRDIARMETASYSSNAQSQQEVARMQQSLQKIASPASTSDASERSQYTMVREKLMSESQKGNLMAKSILSAANTMSVASMPQQRVTEVVQKVANPTIIVAPVEKQKYTEIHDTVVEESNKGNSLAQAVLEKTASVSQLQEAQKKGDKVADAVLNAIQEQSSQQAQLPTINRVQAVSIDDYEEVKKMWTENYKKLEPPQGKDRSEWITQDEKKITDTINLLNSADMEKQKEGMQMVGNVLPFLLIGGFSKTEVTAYLKAKLEAGKSVREETKTKEEEEDSKVAATTTAKTEEKTMSVEAQEESPAPKNLDDMPTLDSTSEEKKSV
jgi:hypothetical protein